MENVTINLEKLCRYQMWADNIVQDIIRGLTEEEFTREIGPPFGSVKNLCVHIVVALEYNIESFIKKIDVNGEELYETLENLSKDELIIKWEETDKKLLEHVKGTTELVRFPNFVSGGDMVLEPEDFYTQYILHTTYHRGQLLSMIKMLGKEGEPTDYLFYLFHLKRAIKKEPRGSVIFNQ